MAISNESLPLEIFYLIFGNVSQSREGMPILFKHRLGWIMEQADGTSLIFVDVTFRTGDISAKANEEPHLCWPAQTRVFKA